MPRTVAHHCCHADGVVVGCLGVGVSSAGGSVPGPPGGPSDGSWAPVWRLGGVPGAGLVGVGWPWWCRRSVREPTVRGLVDRRFPAAPLCGVGRSLTGCVGLGVGSSGLGPGLECRRGVGALLTVLGEVRAGGCLGVRTRRRPGIRGRQRGTDINASVTNDDR